jgi:hypothetical protein
MTDYRIPRLEPALGWEPGDFRGGFRLLQPRAGSAVRGDPERRRAFANRQSREARYRLRRELRFSKRDGDFHGKSVGPKAPPSGSHIVPGPFC